MDKDHHVVNNLVDHGGPWPGLQPLDLVVVQAGHLPWANRNRTTMDHHLLDVGILTLEPGAILGETNYGTCSI